MKLFTNELVNCTYVGDQLIHYGVVGMNSLEWIHEEMMNGVNISFEQWLHETKKNYNNLKEELEGLIEQEPEDGLSEYEFLLQRLYQEGLITKEQKADLGTDVIKSVLEEIENRLETEDFGDYYEDNDCYLIGDWVFDEELQQYKIDENGKNGYAAETGETTVTVLYSKTIKNCMLCSPCYPNAGDLNSPNEDGYPTFDLPKEIYGASSND
jgi:hypothetical protein